MKTLLLVGAGGFIGSSARYLASVFFQSKNSNAFPLHTFVVNIAGCIILGLLTAYYEKNFTVTQDMKLFFTVGLCGGFTTFSAFTLEGMRMLKNDQFTMYFFYSFASVGVCLLAILISYYFVMKLF